MRRVSQTAAGVVLYRRNGGDTRRYLLMRSALTRRPIWEFPKGGVEAGESEAQAAVRELWEEAGIGEGQIVLFDGYREEERYVFTQGKGEQRTLIVKKVVYFLAETDEERVIISREAEEYRWATYDEAMRLIRFPGKRRVLEVAEALLGGDPAVDSAGPMRDGPMAGGPLSDGSIPGGPMPGGPMPGGPAPSLSG
jgi:8-oxo-dGTP pyrophosphatase MutT (NUDIX family)